MTTNKIYHWTTIICFLIPILLIGLKLSLGGNYVQLPDAEFQVQMQYSMDSFPAEKELFVKAYLPEVNQHQEILDPTAAFGGLSFSEQQLDQIGKRGEWRGHSTHPVNINYSFHYKGKALKYNIDKWLPSNIAVSEEVRPYLEPSEYIQSTHPAIIAKANAIANTQSGLLSKVHVLFDYVNEMPSIKTSQLLDAVTTLEQNSASCNGKSRLLVALLRAIDIPARVVGGIILEDIEKRTSHLWVEAWLGGQWVNFDPLNGHFAYLPAHYLQLYKGDHYLIARTPDIVFDYQFNIKRIDYFQAPETAFLSLWPLLNQEDLSPALIKAILLLPLCALLIGIFRNVIGLKTIGVFLPALIAITLDSVGFFFGLAAFLAVMVVVAMLHFPLERWGILQTPKILIMLLGVVLCLVGMSSLGQMLGNSSLQSMLFFPIIILTIAAEKFAKTLAEEGVQDAVKLQLQTVLLVLICYCAYQADFTISFFLSFPEMYLFIIGVLLALGRWIGLRFTELFRFHFLAKA
jgi:hypothetical protein